MGYERTEWEYNQKHKPLWGIVRRDNDWNEGKLYKVVQGHTSQADWTPSELPALYKSYMDENIIAEWEQPQGSHDAYQKGDKVIFDSKVYVSIAENNVWKPTEYGWELE